MTDLEILAIKIATDNKINPDLVRAICETESAWNPWAARFESRWKYFCFINEHASQLDITPETERVLQQTSWGLMQVMGSVARELGFTEELPKLCFAEVGLKYGCLKIKNLVFKYNEESDVISAYNAGSPRKTPGGLYENQFYVDKVHKNLLKIRSLP